MTLPTIRIHSRDNVVIAPRFPMELHVGLTAAAPSVAWFECVPQLDAVASSQLVIEDGRAVAQDMPGLGIEWRWDAIEQRVVLRRSH